MRKSILVLLLISLGIILCANVVSAKQPKLFKQACYEFVGGGLDLNGYHLFLVGKSLGMKVKDENDKFTIYSIAGGILLPLANGSRPVSGTGYYDYELGGFIFELSGLYGAQKSIHCNLYFWDNDDKEAYCATSDDETPIYGLTEVDCRTFDFNGSD